MCTSTQWRAEPKAPKFCDMTQAVSARSKEDDAQWQHKEALVTRFVRELFNRLPALAGFRFRSDLMVAEVSIVGCSTSLTIRRLHVRVMQAFVELAECDPGAMVLMRGRTFARTQY
jgi:hypothetical protein